MSLTEPPDGGGLEPSEAERVQLLAAALRADLADLETYEKVLSNTIADVLPAGVVEVTRKRTMADHFSGRPGSVTSIRIRLGDQSLELAVQHGALVGYVSRNVRGVAISNKPVDLDEWTATLAAALSSFGEQNARARQALERLLGA